MRTVPIRLLNSNAFNGWQLHGSSMHTRTKNNNWKSNCCGKWKIRHRLWKWSDFLKSVQLNKWKIGEELVLCCISCCCFSNTIPTYSKLANVVSALSMQFQSKFKKKTLLFPVARRIQLMRGTENLGLSIIPERWDAMMQEGKKQSYIQQTQHQRIASLLHFKIVF